MREGSRDGKIKRNQRDCVLRVETERDILKEKVGRMEKREHDEYVRKKRLQEEKEQEEKMKREITMHVEVEEEERARIRKKIKY